MAGNIAKQHIFCLKINKKYAKYCFVGKVAHGEFHERERQEVLVPTTKICNGFSVVLGGKKPHPYLRVKIQPIAILFSSKKKPCL